MRRVSLLCTHVMICSVCNQSIDPVDSVRSEERDPGHLVLVAVALGLCPLCKTVFEGDKEEFDAVIRRFLRHVDSRAQISVND